MILFLDFDGVLHPFCPTNPQGAKDFRYLPLLEALLREFPHVEVVITSTRRLTTVLFGLRRRFSEDIAQRVVGVTPSLPFLNLSEGQRHVEIEAWLKANHRLHEPWIALDDSPELFLSSAPLVLCRYGLAEKEVTQLRRCFSENRWSKTERDPR